MAFWVCGLSCRSTAARVGRVPMTVYILNRWAGQGHTKRRGGSQQPTVTNSREDSYLSYMALIDRTSISQALCQ